MNITTKGSSAEHHPTKKDKNVDITLKNLHEL